MLQARLVLTEDQPLPQGTLVPNFLESGIRNQAPSVWRARCSWASVTLDPLS